MTAASKKTSQRKSVTQLANKLYASGAILAKHPPAKGPVTAAEVNEYLRSLPRVTIEDLQRGTA